MNEKEVEKEIQAKGLNAPRLTPALIDQAIVGEYYVQGSTAYTIGGLHSPKTAESLELLTVCVLVLRNGFTVVGKSACASPENFDAELGRKIARDDARGQIWALEGYALKSRLTQGDAS